MYSLSINGSTQFSSSHYLLIRVVMTPENAPSQIIAMSSEFAGAMLSAVLLSIGVLCAAIIVSMVVISRRISHSKFNVDLRYARYIAAERQRGPIRSSDVTLWGLSLEDDILRSHHHFICTSEGQASTFYLRHVWTTDNQSSINRLRLSRICSLLRSHSVSNHPSQYPWMLSILAPT